MRFAHCWCGSAQHAGTTDLSLPCHFFAIDWAAAHLKLTVQYLRDVSYAEANAAARIAALGGRAVPTTAIIAETLVSDWLVEIEVIAAG